MIKATYRGINYDAEYRREMNFLALVQKALKKEQRLNEVKLTNVKKANSALM